MTQLTFVTGLPGSGKSYYAKKVASETGVKFFDDYKSKSTNNDPAFWMSRCYQKLIDKLKSGQDCIVTDVDFYKSASRQEATGHLKTHFDEQLDIQWVFFEKNIEACVQNVCYRAWKEDRSLNPIGKIFAYAVVGDVPRNTNAHPVWSGEQRPKIPKTVFTNEKLFEVVHSLHEGLVELEYTAQSLPLDWAKALATLEVVLHSFSQQFQSA